MIIFLNLLISIYLYLGDEETLSLKSGTDISNLDSTSSETSKGINANIIKLIDKDTK
jgi:hypothetical protein